MDTLNQQLANAQKMQANIAALPAPVIAAPDFGGGLPILPAPTLPKVQSNQVLGDEDKLNSLRSSTPGVAQIHNPFLRGVARTADVLGSVFLPGLSAAIPGTTVHHNLLVNQAQQNLTNDQATAEKQAQTEQTQALTRHTNDVANDLENPTPSFTPIATDSGYAAFNPKTGAATPVNGPDGQPLQAKAPSLAGAYAHAVQQALAGGRDPSKDPVVQHLSDAIVALQPGQNKTQTGEHINVVGPDGKPMIATFHPDTGKTTDASGKEIANPVPYEKPPTVNVNAGIAAIDRETKQFGTPYQKSLDASNAQLEKIADARAMINGNAESQGLGVPKVLTALVGGQGTGVRITQAELDSIAHARGLQGDVEGTLNKWAGKGALSAAQQLQLTQIMDDVKARLLQKQAIASQTLDSINGASSREQIIQADRDARKKLADLENGNGGVISVHAPNGKNYTFADQASADKFKKAAGIK